MNAASIPPPRMHWGLLLAAAATLMITMGARQTTGLFVAPIHQDTGIGIAAENLDKIFVPFEQADTSTTRRFGGTGLGLQLCKRLVNLMAGDIGFSSTPGLGSVFWFVVPLVPKADQAERAPSPLSAKSVGPPIDVGLLLAMLEGGDIEAKALWEGSPSELESLLGGKAADFRDAMQGYDFEAAAVLLRAALPPQGT